MYILDFQVKNYKSYYDSTQIKFTPGINLITGQNNAGKTALLNALSLHFISAPHRSYKTLPRLNKQLDNFSRVNITVATSGQELRDILEERDIDEYYLPLPDLQSPFARDMGLESYNAETVENFIHWIFSQDQLTFHFQYYNGSDSNVHRNHLPGLQFGLYPISTYSAKFRFSRNGEILVDDKMSPRTDNNLKGWVANVLPDKIYNFQAERVPLGQHNISSNMILESDAQNLAQVIDNLQGNPGKFDRYNQLIKQILPQVKRISVRKPQDDRVEIIIWNNNYLDRIDLAVPLHQSGTGIGQVLAILYVVVSSDFPQVILIDEPQSFLHPGAVRKLIETLKENPMHQYIITTHSPTVITASDSKTITLVRQNEGESLLEQMNLNEAEQLRTYLAEIGARLSDVFGADKILWVEGKTEEICFPKILKSLCKNHLLGISIIGILHTSDLENRDADRIVEIYERLSKSNALLPPALGFILDKEDRSKQKLDDIEKRSKGLVKFLPRRLYENYLLNPTAITSIVNSIEGFCENPVSESVIDSWLNEKRKEKKYNLPSKHNAVDESAPWQVNIQGAKLLEDLFKDISSNRIEFHKVSHGLALTEWLIAHSPEDLNDIVNLLDNFLKEEN
jgi:AAA15 family ATPase/GTPase